MTRPTTATFLAALLALGVAACSTPGPTRYSLVPVQSNGADLTGLDSGTILESRQPGGIVSVRADEHFASFGAGFLVAVQNKGGQPQDFGPANVQASVNGQKLAVLAAEELDERVKADVRSYLRATSRTGNADFEAASETATREYRFNNYGGCPAGQAGCQIFSDDNGSNYRQDRINRTLQAQTVAETAVALQANQAAIAQRALKHASVGPEQMAGGVLVVEPPPGGGKVDLTVTFNGQTHRFAFDAKPAALAIGALGLAACGPGEPAADSPASVADAVAPAPAPAATAAPAIEGPAAGKWRISMTTMGQTLPPSEVCYAEQVSLAEAEKMQQQAGVTCSEQSYRRESDAWVGHSVCSMDAGGTPMRVTTDMRVTGDFASKYTMDMTSRMDPAPMPDMAETKMIMTAERIGDC